MSAWWSLVCLNIGVMTRRRLPMWIAGTALLSTALMTATAGVEPGQGYRAMASATRLLAASLFGLMGVLGAVSVSGDAASGALRAVMLRPVSRPAFVLAHGFSTVGVTALVYLLGIAIAYGVAATAYGFGDVKYIEGEFEIVQITRQEMDTIVARLVFLALPGLLVAPLAALAISLNTDDTASAIVLGLIATLGPLLFGLITEEMPSWVFTESALRPLAAFEELAQGIQLQQDVVLTGTFLWDAIRPPLVWAAACLVIGLLTFRRREIRA